MHVRVGQKRSVAAVGTFKTQLILSLYFNAALYKTGWISLTSNINLGLLIATKND